MSRPRKALYMSIAVFSVVAVWALIIAWPSPQFDAALERLAKEKRGEAKRDLSSVLVRLSLEDEHAVVSFVNRGPDVVRLPDEPNGRAFVFRIRDAAGRVMRRSFALQASREAVLVALLPGASYRRDFDIASLRLRPGSYTVSVSYVPVAVNKLFEGIELRSNPVPLEIR